MEETEKKDTNNDDDREVNNFKEPEQMVENMNDTDEVEIFEVADNNLKEVENEEEIRLSGSEWKVFQTNMGSSGEVTEVSGGPGAAGAIKISVTMDSSTEGLYSTVPCP